MTNTVGTHNLLTFARSCRRLEKLAHISTVYVVGRSTGYFDEAPLRHDNGFCNTYQWSKYEAEELVVQAMRDLPAAIFRLRLHHWGGTDGAGAAVQLCTSVTEVISA